MLHASSLPPLRHYPHQAACANIRYMASLQAFFPFSYSLSLSFVHSHCVCNRIRRGEIDTSSEKSKKQRNPKRGSGYYSSPFPRGKSSAPTPGNTHCPSSEQRNYTKPPLRFARAICKKTGTKFGKAELQIQTQISPASLPPLRAAGDDHQDDIWMLYYL